MRYYIKLHMNILYISVCYPWFNLTTDAHEFVMGPRTGCRLRKYLRKGVRKDVFVRMFGKVFGKVFAVLDLCPFLNTDIQHIQNKSFK